MTLTSQPLASSFGTCSSSMALPMSGQPAWWSLVGNALRDSQGNVYIDGRPADGPEGTVVEGQADPTAQVIQVALDGVMRDVNNGVPYDVAVAKIMNHEIVHALKIMDLFTAAEWSLLERLSRTYKKQPEGVTYGQWAAATYQDYNAVNQQEEAIAELISDALTGKTMIGSKMPSLRASLQPSCRKLSTSLSGWWAFCRAE